MKTSVDKLDGLNRKLNVEVPKEKVTDAFTKMYQGIQKNVSIKGFRKGKAPLNKVRSMYKDKVTSDVLQNLISDSYQAALSEHSLDPISQPRLNFEQLIEGEEFKFSAEFEIRPQVEVKKTDGLKLEKEILEIPESEINNAMENVRQNQAKQEDILEDRPAKDGDVAIIDFEGFIGGESLPNGSGENHPLELGSNQFIEGFEEGVLGMKVGDSKDIKLTFPDNYHNKETAGKEVTFKIKLKKLQKKLLPELNDEFAKSLGQFETLDELKQNIRKDILQNEENRIKEDLKQNLLKKLVEANPVEVPMALCERQKATLMADVEGRLRQQGLSDKEILEYKAKWDSDFSETAKFMIQSSFLIDSIALDQKLAATSAEIDSKISEQAKMTGIDLERIKEYYNQSEDRRQHLAYQITEQKVVDFLLGKADVKEVKVSKKV